MPTKDTDLHAPLKKLFGFDSFRDNQQQIIEAIMGGRDAFVVMPTGGGKSLCYQLPAHILPGCSVVVSPLISLMKDQVDGARENGLQAAFMNSSQTAMEKRTVMDKLRAGALDLLYAAPERLALDSFLERLKKIPISLFAIDEAHCISEWGHEFRPDYLFLSSLRKHFPDVPITAFTATATEEVQRDTVRKLGLHEPLMVRASFNRPNLDYQVLPKSRLNEQILSFLQGHAGEAGIIYRTSRKDVEATAAFLVRNGIRALPYHAGLGDQERTRNQEAFNRDDTDVIVATIAFGMGIDKSNVRFILHGDLPKTIENYYQETGRSGRDGLPAKCVLYFSRGDMVKLKFFINQNDPEQQRIATQKLNAMANFASVSSCRRRQLLAYFSERYEPENCESCDICTSTDDRVDVTDDARILIRAVYESGERFGGGQVVDILCGSNTKKVRQYGHEALAIFGRGSEKGKNYWRQLIDELVSRDLITRDEGRYPTLSLGPAASRLESGSLRVEIHPIASAPEKEPRSRSRAEALPHDSSLFEKLRVLRKSIADRHNVPSYVIFHDKTLVEMAGRVPVTREEIQVIHGMGEVKLEKYGEQFLELLREHRRNTPPPRPEGDPGSGTGT
jgi:ATP-dependent DNA helicase RecQ